MADNKKQDIPSEYKISEKWDKCLENFTLHFTAGLVAGGLTSLVLSRTGGARGFLTGLGAGAGAGSSWTTCQMAFAGDDRAKEQLAKAEQTMQEIKDKLQK